MSQTTNTRFTGSKPTVANLDIYNKFDIMEGRIKALEDDIKVKDSAISDLKTKKDDLNITPIVNTASNSYANITRDNTDSNINDAA